MSVDPPRLRAALGLGMETTLNDSPLSAIVARSAWDAWWVAIRSGGQDRPRLDGGPVCAECSPVVLSEVARAVPEHPGPEWRCDCFTTRATAMRSSSPILPRTWALPQRLTVALVKPEVRGQSGF